jgi:hypothetical protein
MSVLTGEISRLGPRPPSSPRQGPRLSTDELSFTIRCEVDHHADEVVERCVGALVQEDGGQSGEREDGETDLERPMEGRAGDEAEGPLECEHAQSADEVDDLQDGEGSHGSVEGSREEVPEDLGPDEARDGGTDLVY